MNKELDKMFEDYNEICSQAVEKAKDIGDYLVSKLKPVLPDLTYSVGWEEDEINIICFNSNSHSFPYKRNKRKSKYYYFSDIIPDIIPKALYHIDDPFGIYLNEKEAEKIKRILKEEK